MNEIVVTPEMVAAGVLADPLACDVPDEDVTMIYTKIYQAMHSAAWRPIETAPDGEDVLTWAETIVPWSIECKNKLGKWERKRFTPTHWMPLPEGPNER